MKRAADTLTPVSLELGGKDPMIVTADADIDRAANAAAFGGLSNTGQICLSVERVYVEEPIYDEFVGKLQRNVESLRQGADGRSYSAEVGAMTSPNQTEIVADHVDDARERGLGSSPAASGRTNPADWYEPTLIADADHSMKVMREETFGPVIPVMKVRDTDEAVRMANDTTYGLGGSVFAGDAERASGSRAESKRGPCSQRPVHQLYVLGLPMGGWKNSGIGYRHGAIGIRKFCRSESINVPRLPPAEAELLWFPYSARQRGVVRRLYRLLNARGLRNRLGHLATPIARLRQPWRARAGGGLPHRGTSRRRPSATRLPLGCESPRSPRTRRPPTASLPRRRWRSGVDPAASIRRARNRPSRRASGACRRSTRAASETSPRRLLPESCLCTWALTPSPAVAGSRFSSRSQRSRGLATAG